MAGFREQPFKRIEVANSMKNQRGGVGPANKSQDNPVNEQLGNRMAGREIEGLLADR